MSVCFSAIKSYIYFSYCPFVTVSAKTCIVCTKSEFNFIPIIYRHTHIYPSLMYQVLNVNWSTFLKGILPTLQSHGWNNGTHGGQQVIGQWEPGFAPTGYEAHYCVIGHCVGVIAALGVSQMVVFATSLPTHPTPLPAPIPPTPSIINFDGKRDGKNTIKFSHQR